MPAVILKCKPGSRFHLGQAVMRQNETLTDTGDVIHSDVLFGAFIHTIAQYNPEEVAKWKNFFESGKLIFSSAYYCLEQQQKFIYLLPKPASLNLFDITDDSELLKEHKKIKKIKFISKGVWEKQLLPADWISNDLCFLPEKRVVLLKEELPDAPPFKLSEKADTQKVRVRTNESEGNLYTQTDLVMMGNKDIAVHWYFLLEMSTLSDAEQKEAKKCIERMAENGIGGERSTGCGQIASVEFDDKFTLPDFPDSGQSVSLSLTIPQKNEQDKLLYYQVMPRGGMYYGSGEQRINIVNMLAEGAVLKEKIIGSIADLSTENKKHWRGGTCYSVSLPTAYKI